MFLTTSLINLHNLYLNKDQVSSCTITAKKTKQNKNDFLLKSDQTWNEWLSLNEETNEKKKKIHYGVHLYTQPKTYEQRDHKFTAAKSLNMFEI